jgi:hypothetical protein
MFRHPGPLSGLPRNDKQDPAFHLATPGLVFFSARAVP